MKLVLTLALYAVLAGLIATRPRADDIDIYPAWQGAGAVDMPCEDTAAGSSRTLVAGSTPVNSPGDERDGRDIYFALFQPDAGSLWPGNVKKLKIVPRAGAGGEAGDVEAPGLVAQAPLTDPPRPALSEVDGQILPDALTFWTDPLGADVLAFDAGRREVPGRDGRSVTRGGAGQQVTGFLGNAVGAGNGDPGARQVFTIDPGNSGELLALDATSATLARIATHLDPNGLLTEAQGLELIRWIRGQDSFDADGDGDRLESRRWLLADPLHSRPLAVSYGARPGTAYRPDSPDIRIFFGTNDGLFHVLQNTTASGDQSGRETWAFLPPELLGMQSGLAPDSVDTPQARPYGLDGEPVALITDRDRDGNIEPDDGDSVLVFIGQRRGGTGLYAFDVTDPDRPAHRWTIDNRTPGFEQLALTFSTPRVALVDLGASVPTPVLVFAGGYNGGWAGTGRLGKDAGGGSDPVGNAIYVVNPQDGSLVWRAVGPGGGAAPDPGVTSFFAAGLTDSIPAPVSVVDSDHNGVDDRAYVGDSGGHVWRVELTEYARRAPDSTATDARNWYLTRLASLGGSGDADRRFFHAADVVQSRDGAGEYDGVVIVSGNRAAPRELEARNFAYLLKDRGTAGSGSGAASPATIDIRHDQLADITGACRLAGSSACLAAELALGWKLELSAPGEKGLSAPLVSSGRVLFTSYVPFAGDASGESPDACVATEGFGRLYWLKLGNGAPALPLPGNVVPPDGSGGGGEDAVRYQGIGPGLPGDVVPLGNGILIPGQGLGGSPLVTVPGEARWRAYWREEGVDTL